MRFKHEVVKSGCHRFYFPCPSGRTLSYLINKNNSNDWSWSNEADPTFGSLAFNLKFTHYKYAKQNLFEVAKSFGAG